MRTWFGGRGLHPVQAWTVVSLAGVLLWDASGGDMALAAWAGDGHGFALRDHWLLDAVLHDGARKLVWLLELALCLGVWWPWGPLRRIGLGQRLQLAVTGLLAASAVSVVKSFSLTSCPWDLQEFGGLARHLSHWQVRPDGGPGRCFPAGHASAGFGFLGGYFAFREGAPVVARLWLAGALAAGLVLGLAQQWRGAHFMSHTLWSGWLCWVVALGVDQSARVIGRYA